MLRSSSFPLLWCFSSATISLIKWRVHSIVSGCTRRTIIGKGYCYEHPSRCQRSQFSGHLGSRILWTSSRPLHLVLHRDVGALFLLRPAAAVSALHVGSVG